jgi:nucleoside-diphosphate-sugar epimerase
MDSKKNNPMRNGKISKVLVTGSSGFIGAHLVKRLIDHGYVVYGIDINVPAFSASDFSFVQCDILNTTELNRVLSDCQPQAVIHLAARTDLGGKKVSDYAVNIEGVKNLVEAIADTHSVRRCIYTSSQLVCRVGYMPKAEQDYRPNTPYGESKVFTEQIVRQYDGGGVAWCLVRPTTIWGAGMRPHYQRFLELIRRGKYFHVGYRPLYKSYGYIGNTVYQYQKLLESPAEWIRHKTFYLADYQPISLRAWVDAFQRELCARPVFSIPESLAKIIAVSGNIINVLGFKEFPFNLFRLNNILTEYVFDLSATEQVCGPLPYTMEQGEQETATWIRTLG